MANETAAWERKTMAGRNNPIPIYGTMQHKNRPEVAAGRHTHLQQNRALSNKPKLPAFPLKQGLGHGSTITRTCILPRESLTPTGSTSPTK